MSNTKSYSLKDLYAHLSPDGLGDALKDETRRQLKQTDSTSLLEEIMNLCLNPTGIFYPAAEIKKNIEERYKKASKEEKGDEVGLLFHMIGSSGIGIVDFDDKDYWGEKVKVIDDLIPSRKVVTDQKAAAFITRSPFMTPATRGTDSIDFFLNYTPPIVAAQMMPYLDVEFEFSRGSIPKDASGVDISTPSIMRFLLGPKANNTSQLSEADKIIENAGIQIVKPKTTNIMKSGKTNPENINDVYAFSGMEMFLMPQTLTNMDGGLSPTQDRLARAKPFLPFASIEGFEVQIQNAGAGKFAHKTGTLRMKIHDKARLSEFSQFIKGSSGYNRAVVWTTYGWVAPRIEEKAVVNEYSKFINDKMMIRECWQVVNPQFTFDAAGQVSLTLSLVSKSQRKIEETEVGAGLDGAKEKIIQFNDLLARLKETKEEIDRLSGNGKFSIDVQATQVLNAASTTGEIGNIDKVAEIIRNFMNSLKGHLDQSKLDSLTKDLKALGDKGGTSLYAQRNEAIASGVYNLFNKIGNDPDPFQPNKNSKGDSVLYQEIEKFKKKPDATNQQIKEDNKKLPNPLRTKKLDDKSRVVSFGKLFLNFVVPALLNPSNCDELQVFFYGLNDQCGPVKNHSVAEFPVDVLKLEYAYAEAIKNSGTDSLSLEQFMTLVIQTQFDDESSIAYGMNELYEPFTGEGQPKQKAQDQIASAMAEWTRKYGALKKPIIEMYMESGEKGHSNESIVQSLKRGAYRLKQEDDNAKTGGKYIIKRIHIYDKQCNPYKLFQQIINAGNNEFSLGTIDKTKAESAVSEVYSKLNKQQIEELNKALAGATSETLRSVLSKYAPDTTLDKVEIVNKPMGFDVKIKGNPKSIKQQMMRFVPNIVIGTNGTMVISANMSSKTDGLQGSINIINANKSQKGGSASANGSNTTETAKLPMYTVPAQLTMTTMGVPTAQLYQQFFVDFDTGTTLDNLYTCTQLQHSIANGKFTTNWTFAYTDGYGKFTGAPTLDAYLLGMFKEKAESASKQAQSKPVSANQGTKKK